MIFQSSWPNVLIYRRYYALCEYQYVRIASAYENNISYFDQLLVTTTKLLSLTTKHLFECGTCQQMTCRLVLFCLCLQNQGRLSVLTVHTFDVPASAWPRWKWNVLKTYSYPLHMSCLLKSYIFLDCWIYGYCTVLGSLMLASSNPGLGPMSCDSALLASLSVKTALLVCVQWSVHHLDCLKYCIITVHFRI